MKAAIQPPLSKTAPARWWWRGPARSARRWWSPPPPAMPARPGRHGSRGRAESGHLCPTHRPTRQDRPAADLRRPGAAGGWHLRRCLRPDHPGCPGVWLVLPQYRLQSLHRSKGKKTAALGNLGAGSNAQSGMPNVQALRAEDLRLGWRWQHHFRHPQRLQRSAGAGLARSNAAHLWRPGRRLGCDRQRFPGRHRERSSRSQRKTLADSISVDLPRDGVRAVRAAAQTGGSYILVSDAEILAAIAALGKAGIFAEPAGATSYAGLVKAVQQGLDRAG